VDGFDRFSFLGPQVGEHRNELIGQADNVHGKCVDLDAFKVHSLLVESFLIRNEPAEDADFVKLVSLEVESEA